MNRYANRINSKIGRLAFLGGTAIFGYAMLEEIVSPFIPLAAAIISGLIIGLILRAFFAYLVNRKLNSTYRYTKRTEKTAEQKENIHNRTENTNTGYAENTHSQPDSLSLYRSLLGLGQSFTQDELKAAYHSKAAIYHPDRYAAASRKESENAEILMKQVNEAFEKLKNTVV